MLKLYLSLSAVLLSFTLFAQQNISEARRLAVGAKVTISGIVTNGGELGTIRYIQDETAGIAIYDSKLTNVKRGDSITVAGEIDDYNNLLEIKSVSDLTIHSSGNTLPLPKIIGIENMGEDYEGQLVQIANITIDNAGGTFAGNKNYYFSDGTNTGTLRINSGSPIVGQNIPPDKFSLTALCSQFSYDANNTQDGYQLIPRDMDDFFSGKSVNFTAPAQVTHLTKESLTLVWATDVESSSDFQYGSTPFISEMTNFVSGSSVQENGEFIHEVNITGLQPAELIYARAFSVHENDTAFSSILVYATESNSSGKINAYFNTGVKTELAKTTVAANIGNALEDTLIAYFNRAQYSIDFCIYNINNSGLSNVSEALNDAYNRGVTVRVISCGVTAHLGTDDLLDDIPYLEGPEEYERDGIMHNKFAVIDAGAADPDLPVVWSGSTNMTYGQIETDANNIIFIQDQSLAKAYTLEFEEMWGGSGTQFNSSESRFGAEKTDNTPHEFVIGGKRVECYFSPSDGTNQKIIDAINTADNDLNVETMLITRSDIAYAIRDAVNRGVKVHVLTNESGGNSGTVNSVLNDVLREHNYIQDQTGAGILHHKLAIVDANFAASDPLLITGSHNWSNSANDRNDENTLIIHDAAIANQYLQQFAYRFEENGGDLYVSAEFTELSSVKVFPNPVVGKVYVSAQAPISYVNLYNINGKLMLKKDAAFASGIELEMSDRQPGTYLLLVELQDGSQNIYKVVKN